MLASRKALETSVLIRAERATDHGAVHALNVAAFGTCVEGDLVDRLRRDADRYISLVADADGNLVGHIFFTPVALSQFPRLRLMGLAPMAVAATHRGQGVGIALGQKGLAHCAQAGYGGVVVLGHPAYYPRFGFKPAADFGLRCEFDVPSEAFMAIELERNYLAGAYGTVTYHAAFKDI